MVWFGNDSCGPEVEAGDRSGNEGSRAGHENEWIWLEFSVAGKYFKGVGLKIDDDL